MSAHLNPGYDHTEALANALRMEAASKREQLAADVAMMRDLGVLEWGDIKLGPVPNSGPAEDETQRSLKLEKQEQERRTRLRFAASGGPRSVGGT